MGSRAGRIRRDIVDNRLLEDVKDTEPYKWNGGNPNLPTECGPRTEKYFWRSQIYSALTLTDLALFVRNMGRRPNRLHPANGAHSAQERGKAIFDRVTDKFGHANSADRPMCLLPQRPQRHQPENL